MSAFAMLRVQERCGDLGLIGAPTFLTLALAGALCVVWFEVLKRIRRSQHLGLMGTALKSPGV